MNKKKVCITINHGYPTDQIVCFAIPIYYSYIYDIVIKLKPTNEKRFLSLKTLKFFYKQYKKISIYECDNVLNYVRTYKHQHPNYEVDYLPHGICYIKQNINFIQNRCLTLNTEKYLAGSEYFYSNFTKNILDPSICFKYFEIHRDKELELEKYKKSNIYKEDKYFCINTDIKNYNINLVPKYKYYNLNFSSYFVFDNLLIIENCKEIHLISTFYSLIIYYLQLKYNMFSDISIYFHSYVRHGRLDCLYTEFNHIKKLNNWTFINCPNDCTNLDHRISGL